MDIVTVVERYIKLAARCDEQKDTIQSNDGYLSFMDEDEKKEKLNIQTAKTLSQVSQIKHLLDSLRQTYNKIVSVAEAVELKEAALALALIKADLVRQIKELEEQSRIASMRSDEAWKNDNKDAEAIYMTEVTNCYFKIEKIKPTIKYYEEFRDDLNNKADAKLINMTLDRR